LVITGHFRYRQRNRKSIARRPYGAGAPVVVGEPDGEAGADDVGVGVPGGGVGVGDEDGEDDVGVGVADGEDQGDRDGAADPSGAATIPASSMA
jgi:hypothetical protein